MNSGGSAARVEPSTRSKMEKVGRSRGRCFPKNILVVIVRTHGQSCCPDAGSAATPDSSPDTRDRRRKETIPERYGVRAVIQHDAKAQRLACGASELSQPLEIGRLHGGRCLHLDADELGSLILDHEVDFVLVLVSVMRDRVSVIEPAALFEDLGEHERFQQGAEDRAIAGNSFMSDTGDRREQAGIEK